MLYQGVVSDIVAYEEGTMLEEDIPAFFQRLIDSGMIECLQGSYQRAALDYIESGECHRRTA
jgi:hypothetical protein